MKPNNNDMKKMHPTKETLEQQIDLYKEQIFELCSEVHYVTHRTPNLDDLPDDVTESFPECLPEYREAYKDSISLQNRACEKWCEYRDGKNNQILTDFLLTIIDLQRIINEVLTHSLEKYEPAEVDND